MKRNTLALAIAGAFALPAGVMAQSTVQIYGNLRLAVEHVDSGVDNVGGGRMRVTNPGGSLLGFRGTEALGGGLSAWWQIEQNIGGADGTRGDVSTMGGRSTGTGLFGAWGRVILGNWNSPYKDFAGLFQPFGATALGGTNSIMNNGDSTGPAPLGIRINGAQPITVSSSYNGVNSSMVATNTTVIVGGVTSAISTSALGSNALTTQLSVAGPTTSFHRRWHNTVQYRGSFSGFNANVAYQMPEGEQGQTGPDAWGASLYYGAGPLTVGGAYSRHNSFTSAVVNGVLQDTTDSAWMVGAKYTFGAFEVGFAWERLEYDVPNSNAGAMGNLENDRWQLHGQFRSGPHRFGGMYIYADDTKGSAGTPLALVSRGSLVGNGGAGSTSANQWNLVYGYSLSKRTELTLSAARISNDSQIAYDMSSSTTGTGTGATNLGATRKGFAVTMYHAF